MNLHESTLIETGSLWQSGSNFFLVSLDNPDHNTSVVDGIYTIDAEPKRDALHTIQDTRSCVQPGVAHEATQDTMAAPGLVEGDTLKWSIRDYG